MKRNAVVLHGTEGNSQDNWFPRLKQELEKHDFSVWVPDLPHAEKPNIERYNKFLFAREDWNFNEHSCLIGHSSGAVAIFGLLEAFPEKTIVDYLYFRGCF